MAPARLHGPEDSVSMEEIWIPEMLRDKEGDASNEWNEKGKQVNKSKDRKCVARGDSIELNSIHDDRKCDEVASIE
jgi:hypothetical protein